jgi:predicted DNA-binding helix-hairpin-helix protein
MPEASPDRIAPAGRYADRLSRNVEEILVDEEGGMLDLSPDPKLAWVRKHHLGMPLRGAPPFLLTPDHRPRGPVAPQRQPELLAHA